MARHVALFFGDYFARPSKRSGAWMSSFRSQERLAGDITPIVVNVMNFSKGGEGQPSLLSFDDARTLFHEFGHGLHGMLSDVTYPLLSGTGVVRDFVEFPSQLYEHWLEEPEVLQRFARHHETGAPMPKELLDRLLASRTFNQGFATVEYISSALYDLEVHAAPGGAPIDPAAEERRILAEIAMPEGMVMRHRPTALPARLRRRRLFVGLLQLPVVGGPRRRRLQGLPRGGRHLRSGDGRSPQGLCLRGRQPARARGSLSGLPGPRPRRERASPQAGARRGLGRGSAPESPPSSRRAALRRRSGTSRGVVAGFPATRPVRERSPADRIERFSARGGDGLERAGGQLEALHGEGAVAHEYVRHGGDNQEGGVFPTPVCSRKEPAVRRMDEERSHEDRQEQDLRDTAVEADEDRHSADDLGQI